MSQEIRLLPYRPLVAALVIVVALLLAFRVEFAAADREPLPQLELLRTVGDGGEVILYSPDSPRFAEDGSCYLINQGEKRVLHFDADWNLLKVFGREGEGPGEFANPLGMIIHQDMIWIFEYGRVTQFRLDGSYHQTLLTDLQLHDAVVTGEGIVARVGSGGARAAIMVDEALETLLALGPVCPDDDVYTTYRACGFMVVRQHPDYLCLLINTLDGQVFCVDEAGEVAREFRLTDRSGYSTSTVKDGKGIMRFAPVLRPGRTDAAGRWWLVPPHEDRSGDDDGDENEDETERSVIVRAYERDLERYTDYEMPPGVWVSDIAHAPTGELVVVNSSESLIYIMAYPEDPAR